MSTIDLSQLPICDGQPADFVLHSVCGGLVISAKVGNSDTMYGDTIQEALDKAIKAFHELSKTADWKLRYQKEARDGIEVWKLRYREEGK